MSSRIHMFFFTKMEQKLNSSVPIYVTDVLGQDLCMPNVCPPSVVDKNQVWVIFDLRTDFYQFLYYILRKD